MGCIRVSSERIWKFELSVSFDKPAELSAERIGRFLFATEKEESPLIGADRYGRPRLSCSFVCGLSLGPEMTLFDASDGWFVTADGLRIQILI